MVWGKVSLPNRTKPAICSHTSTIFATIGIINQNRDSIDALKCLPAGLKSPDWWAQRSVFSVQLWSTLLLSCCVLFFQGIGISNIPGVSNQSNSRSTRNWQDFYWSNHRFNACSERIGCYSIYCTIQLCCRSFCHLYKQNSHKPGRLKVLHIFSKKKLIHMTQQNLVSSFMLKTTLFSLLRGKAFIHEGSRTLSYRLYISSLYQSFFYISNLFIQGSRNNWRLFLKQRSYDLSRHKGTFSSKYFFKVVFLITVSINVPPVIILISWKVLVNIIWSPLILPLEILNINNVLQKI